MGNAHKMIVYYVCKVVGRITIRFDQYHIIQFRVIYSDISVDLVMEGGSSLSRVILTDNKWLSSSQICLDFLFGKVQTVLIIGHDLLTVYSLS